MAVSVVSDLAVQHPVTHPTFAASSILLRLLLETCGEHEAIEQVFDLMSATLTQQSYCQQLEQFSGFYAPLEKTLQVRNKLPQQRLDDTTFSPAISAGAALADVASGLLPAPLSSNGPNLKLWFGPEVKQTINSGSNPHDKPQVTGPNGPRLTPTRSFELFSESVHQQARPWLDVELEAATRLRALIMDLVIARAERIEALSDELARTNEEFDAFFYVASHDLKEPLRGIHKYAHQLLEAAPANQEDKRKLDGRMRLTLRMDSLPDSLLHFSRVGREELALEKVDLNEVLADAMEMVGSRTGDGCTEIVAPRALPLIICDRVRVREVLVNLLSNAIKYNDKAFKRVEVGFVATHETTLRGAFPEGTSAQTVYYVRDNGIGIASRHFDQAFKMFKRLHGRGEFGGGTGAGLTIVRKLVERHGGQVWLESAAGQGSTFYFNLSAFDDN